MAETQPTLTASEKSALGWLHADGSERLLDSFDLAITLISLEERGLAESGQKGSRVLPLRWRITPIGRETLDNA